MDVADQTSIDNAVKHIEAAEGRLDILVNWYVVTKGNPLLKILTAPP